MYTKSKKTTGQTTPGKQHRQRLGTTSTTTPPQCAYHTMCVRLGALRSLSQTIALAAVVNVLPQPRPHVLPPNSMAGEMPLQIELIAESSSATNQNVLQSALKPARARHHIETSTPASAGEGKGGGERRGKNWSLASLVGSKGILDTCLGQTAFKFQ